MTTDATPIQTISASFTWGIPTSLVEKYIDPDRYDLLIYLTPDVRWVPDGQRLNGDEDRRRMLNDRLWDMYVAHGFKDKMVVVSGGLFTSGWRMPSGWWTSFWAARSHRGKEILDKFPAARS